ncbi:hypothetical protein [Aquimarina sp. AU474]|uniref:hypothetical protein n=1 Tax=Aquimarina sp. AU474 TaxID=2108529 RepID=UPI000D69F107|nr:hypothetical protein [Aquimarina sp. AU474]
MKYVVIVCFLILSSNHTYSQYLAEQEWALFSSHIAKGDLTGFEELLAQKDYKHLLLDLFNEVLGQKDEKLDLEYP